MPTLPVSTPSLLPGSLLDDLEAANSLSGSITTAAVPTADFLMVPANPKRVSLTIGVNGANTIAFNWRPLANNGDGFALVNTSGPVVLDKRVHGKQICNALHAWATVASSIAWVIECVNNE